MRLAGSVNSFLFFLVMMTVPLSGQVLVINEMMSLNSGYLLDADGDSSDWVELYNTTDGVINLNGYCLSDDFDNLCRWTFPDTVIIPGQYMVVFASGKDRAVTGEQLHTNFSIKSSGEDLYLTHQGMIVHFMPAVELASNISYGLHADGEHPFALFSQPTPGASNNGASQAATVSFSVPGGFYDHRFTISLTSSQHASRIFYTTNGTIPTPVSSHLYEDPLFLDYNLLSPDHISQIQVSPDDLYNPPDTGSVPKVIVVRAAAFDSLNNRLSPVETHTYLIREMGAEHYNLPVVSLCAQLYDLFDHQKGIFVPGITWSPDYPDWSGNYHQKGPAWERTVSVEYYDHNNQGFRQDAGLRIHGGHTRQKPQKPLRLYARSEYGHSEFSYPVFGPEGLQEYKILALKPFAASWSNAGFEDHLCNLLVHGSEADAIRSRPVVLYINGEYWGIYFIQERIDHHLIGELQGLHPDSVNIVENWFGDAQSGSGDDFVFLYDFIEKHDLSIPVHYQTVEGMLDIGNFIDYVSFQIFSANIDWPANNMKCWKGTDEGSKWRWIFFDGDAALQRIGFDAFGHAMDTGEEYWPTNAYSTLFFRKLMENSEFRELFFGRMEVLLNHQLGYPRTSELFDATVAAVYGEVGRQSARFGTPVSHIAWADQVVVADHFLSMRACEIKRQLQETFGVTINVPRCRKEQVVISDMLIYPNPHGGDFGFRFESSASSMATIRISNLLGQTLYEGNTLLTSGLNQIRISDATLPEGVLVISVITSNSVYGIKMMCHPRNR